MSIDNFGPFIIWHLSAILWVVSGTFWAISGQKWDSLRDFGPFLGSFWSYFGVTLGWFCHRSDIVLELFWHRFGLILGPFWCVFVPCGRFLRLFVSQKPVIFGAFGREKNVLRPWNYILERILRAIDLWRNNRDEQLEICPLLGAEKAILHWDRKLVSLVSPLN